MAQRGEGPRRTCAGCGSVRAQHELVRFGVVDGVLTRGRTLSGRGAYTCPSRACLERAISRRSFGRILRTQVVVPESIAAALYTDEHDG
jgi:predicted RNA-binding protein YlxR (DUF448 family)